MKKIFLSVLSVSLFFASHSQSSANTSQTVTLNLQNAIDISVVTGTATGTTFTFNTIAQYTSGQANTNASQFSVRSNKPWAVTVASAATNFTSTTTTPMPSSVLGVRLNGQTGSYTPLSTTAANFTSGARGTNTFSVDYEANPGFNYDAGSYTINVVYTATQQ